MKLMMFNAIALTLAMAAFTVTAADLRLDGGDEFGWNENNWFVQVDGVMGGQSTGSLQYEDDGGTMVFSGGISLVGGGFSSVRTKFQAIDLSMYAGIVVELEADDIGESMVAPLGMHLQLHDRKSRYGFAAAFAVPLAEDSGTISSVFLPLEKFDRGSRLGFACSSCSLDVTTVNEMDAYVLFQDGPFNVRLKSITAVEETFLFPIPEVSLGSSDSVVNLLKVTISSGGSLYDMSYVELCISMYWSTINTIVAASEGVPDSVKLIACAGLLQATKELTKSETAWTLRKTMDVMLDDLQGVQSNNNYDWLPSANAEDSVKQCTGITSMVSTDFYTSLNTTLIESASKSRKYGGEQTDSDLSSSYSNGVMQISSMLWCITSSIVIFWIC